LDWYGLGVAGGGCVYGSDCTVSMCVLSMSVMTKYGARKMKITFGRRCVKVLLEVWCKVISSLSCIHLHDRS
jgi:hypothetical protein